MDTKHFRKERDEDRINFPDDQQRSHLVHRVGSVGTGLFPGWGPKL